MAKYIGAKTKIEYGNADEFGRYYIGSSMARHNALKRKKYNKQK